MKDMLERLISKKAIEIAVLETEIEDAENEEAANQLRVKHSSLINEWLELCESLAVA